MRLHRRLDVEFFSGFEHKSHKTFGVRVDPIDQELGENTEYDSCNAQWNHRGILEWCQRSELFNSRFPLNAERSEEHALNCPQIVRSTKDQSKSAYNGKTFVEESID